MIASKILGQFDRNFKDSPSGQPMFPYVEFRGESENKLENAKFSSTDTFYSVLLTLV